MKKLFICGFFVLLMQISAFAEAQLPFIESWKDGTAYISNGTVITDCIAYDYLTDNENKFVKLDASGKEVARAATPEELQGNNENPTGTIELHVKVPENIDNAVEIVIGDDEENSYTLTAYRDNDYVSYTNVPSGTYSIFSAWIKNDYKGEYPVKCDTEEIVIEPSSAVKIEAEVSEKKDLTDSSSYIESNSLSPAMTTVDSLPSLMPLPSVPTFENVSVQPVGGASLLKSTIITLMVLAALFICYFVATWYKNHKKK